MITVTKSESGLLITIYHNDLEYEAFIEYLHNERYSDSITSADQLNSYFDRVNNDNFKVVIINETSGVIRVMFVYTHIIKISFGPIEMKIKAIDKDAEINRLLQLVSQLTRQQDIYGKSYDKLLKMNKLRDYAQLFPLVDCFRYDVNNGSMMSAKYNTLLHKYEIEIPTCQGRYDCSKGGRYFNKIILKLVDKYSLLNILYKYKTYHWHPVPYDRSQPNVRNSDISQILPYIGNELTTIVGTLGGIANISFLPNDGFMITEYNVDVKWTLWMYVRVNIGEQYWHLPTRCHLGYATIIDDKLWHQHTRICNITDDMLDRVWAHQSDYNTTLDLAAMYDAP